MKAGTNTWPIVLVSYVYLNKDWSAMTADKAGLLKAFMDYITGTQGQGMLADFSFNMLPPSMNQWSTLWADGTIAQPASVTAFTFLTATDPWNGMAENEIGRAHV